MESVSSSQQNHAVSMKDLLNQENFNLPKVGEIMKGEVISMSKNGVLIDLGSLGTGIVYPGEFYDKPTAQKSLKPGQEISAVLLDIETEDGFRELSLRQAQQTTAWQEIKRLKDSGEIITSQIANINKGGVIVEIQGIQGFLPLSQLGAEHYPKVDGGDTTKIVQALQKIKGKEVKVKILDFNEEQEKLIISEKAVGDEKIKKEIEKFKVGDVVEGKITGVTDFGAFVSVTAEAATAETPAVAKAMAGKQKKKEDTEEAATTEDQNKKEGEEKTEKSDVNAQTSNVPSVEGLIHISEIDWKLIDDPRDYLKRGDKIKAKIISKDGSKISLSMKALKPDPWLGIEKKYEVGQMLEATITKVNNYGALAALEENIVGLIPSSEFPNKNPQEEIKAGDKAKVAIVSIEPQDHKMLLTLASKKDEATAESNSVSEAEDVVN